MGVVILQKNTNSKNEYFLCNIEFNKRLLSKSFSSFNYQNCFFNIQRERESTARVVAYKEFGIIKSYTCEASFCGPSIGDLIGQHFSPTLYHVVSHIMIRNLELFIAKLFWSF